MNDAFMASGGLLPRQGQLRKVLVVGAGVAGLQAARQFIRLGCEVLVLDSSDAIGGVWIRNYVGFGLQVPWSLYQFPEFPWPPDLRPSSDYPTGEEVLQYVQAYASCFDLERHVRLNSQLLRLRWLAGSRQWDALYCDTVAEKFYKVTVDYAVICAGIYSQPYVPNYEGSDSYSGIQMHAKHFMDLALARGRRVLIVGAGKTALDCVSSVVSTNSASSVTMLYRQAHWPVPRKMLGMGVRQLMFNRAMTAMLPPYYTAGSAGLMAARAAAPLKKLFWRGLEFVIGRTFKISEQMRPHVHLPKDMFYGGQILDTSADELIRSAALKTVKGEIGRFVHSGVILQNGAFVAADLVLYCTGYLKSYEYLDEDVRLRLDLQKDGLYLYRNMLPCAVPHLAFVGSEVSTYNNILTGGLQALWLADLLAGRVRLPPPAAMAEDVRQQQRWRRGVMPAQRSRGSVLMLYMMQYHDQLLKDMGLAHRRKGLNLVAECFGAYTAREYRGLLEQHGAVLKEAGGGPARRGGGPARGRGVAGSCRQAVPGRVGDVAAESQYPLSSVALGRVSEAHPGHRDFDRGADRGGDSTWGTAAGGCTPGSDDQPNRASDPPGAGEQGGGAPLRNCGLTLSNWGLHGLSTTGACGGLASQARSASQTATTQFGASAPAAIAFSTSIEECRSAHSWPWAPAAPRPAAAELPVAPGHPRAFAGPASFRSQGQRSRHPGEAGAQQQEQGDARRQASQPPQQGAHGDWASDPLPYPAAAGPHLMPPSVSLSFSRLDGAGLLEAAEAFYQPAAAPTPVIVHDGHRGGDSPTLAAACAPAPAAPRLVLSRAASDPLDCADAEQAFESFRGFFGSASGPGTWCRPLDHSLQPGDAGAVAISERGTAAVTGVDTDKRISKRRRSMPASSSHSGL